MKKKKADKEKWLKVAEVKILQELMKQQENEYFGEFSQYGFEKRNNLEIPKNGK